MRSMLHTALHLPLALPIALLLTVQADAQDMTRFRQWMMDLEVGGLEVKTTKDAQGERIASKEWTRVERKLGEGKPIVIEATQEDSALRKPDGSMEFAWTMQLGATPWEGRAQWNPQQPTRLQLHPKNSESIEVAVIPNGLLWPGDVDAAMREAARRQQPLHLVSFAFAQQQWTTLDAQPKGPSPLPGFPEAVKYEGKETSALATMDVQIWISPRQGELKRMANQSGISILVQRAELPAPAKPDSSAGFFERSLIPLPAHPFLLWIPEATLTWKGSGKQELVEDAQQQRLSENTYRVRGTTPPTPSEASELPIKGKPKAEDAIDLAPSPFVPYQDPIFDGIQARLNPSKKASRWELAQQVTHFVYDWITQKDLSVGFGTALDVARNPVGDCTEHSVFAVALLRRLGVPARGVVGWVGVQNMMGLHFWVEVKLGSRWIPIDPTFDQAPASTLRLKADTKDLVDASTLSWSNGLQLVGGTWVPVGTWTNAVRIQGDSVTAPDGTCLRVPSARWEMEEGLLSLKNPKGSWTLEAAVRPDGALREKSRLIMGPTTSGKPGRQGWWNATHQKLWMDLGDGRWLQVSDCTEAQAFWLLENLECRSLF